MLVLLMLLFEMQRASDVAVCVTQITPLGEWLREEPTDQHDKGEGKRGYRQRFVCLLFAIIL